MGLDVKIFVRAMTSHLIAKCDDERPNSKFLRIRSGCGGGEIDSVMSDKDGTLVFREVRYRTSASHGGAEASISAVK